MVKSGGFLDDANSGCTSSSDDYLLDAATSTQAARGQAAEIDAQTHVPLLKNYGEISSSFDSNSNILTAQNGHIIGGGASSSNNGSVYNSGAGGYSYGKSGLVKVKIDSDESSGEFGSPGGHTVFPRDPEKLLAATMLLFLAALSNDLVLAYIHEKVPETAPLPDLIFRHTPRMTWFLAASEYIIMVSGICMAVVCFLHKYRWVLFRRVFVISALLYLGRSVCMLVTQVPVADPTYYCSPKMNHTSSYLIFRRAFHLISGLGMKINGKHTLCGDYIYSGHTLVLVMTYLTVQEYSPRKWWFLHWGIWLLSFSGVAMLLLSRAHYTVDVIIGITHKLDEQFVKHEVSEFSMERNPNVELSSACGRGLSAQPHALDSSTFGFHSIENSDTSCFTNCSSNLCVIP